MAPAGFGWLTAEDSEPEYLPVGASRRPCSRGCSPRQARWARLAIAPLGALAAVLIYGGPPRAQLLRGGDGLVGLSKRFCYGSQLSINFGTGLTKFDLDDGSDSVTRSCPYGSPNPAGKIRFSCLLSGLWNMTEQSCYACPALREKVVFPEGHSRLVALPPAGAGAVRTLGCSFDDGVEYPTGSIKFECQGGRWQHLGSSCSATLCRPGNVTVDFHGSLGKVRLPIGGSSDAVALACPEGSPNHDGSVRLRCKRSREDPDVGGWEFVDQDCQACNPTTMKVTVGETFHRPVELPGAKEGDVVEEKCVFNDGAKTFSRGVVTAVCRGRRWALANTTCRDWDCPEQTAVLKTEFHEAGQAMGGTFHVTVRAAFQGRAEYPCPEGMMDPEGKLAVECMPSGKWEVREACGRGTGGVGPARALLQ